MASRSQRRQPLAAALQEFFVCSQCGKGPEYMQDPVLLPCLHSICIECLDTRVRLSQRRDEVECPTCTQRACIPPGGLKAFPEDKFSRMAIKTLTDPEFTYLPGGPNPKCGLHPKEEVSNYCQKCHVQVCRKCVTSHHKDHEAEIRSLRDVADRMDQQLTSTLDGILLKVAIKYNCVLCNDNEVTIFEQ